MSTEPERRDVWRWTKGNHRHVAHNGRIFNLNARANQQVVDMLTDAIALTDIADTERVFEIEMFATNPDHSSTDLAVTLILIIGPNGSPINGPDWRFEYVTLNAPENP